MTIKKKIWPQYFELVASGKKKFEFRLADFEVNEGDILVLEEWDPQKKEYTGKKLETTVTYVMKTKDQPFYTQEQADKYGFQVLQIELK